MFETLRLILYANKIADKYTRIKILNKIDVEIAMQGFYVRFSYKQNYILACINSWLGHSKHCNSYNLVNKIFEEFVLKK